jgi:Uma2 family endonuclease
MTAKEHGNKATKAVTNGHAVPLEKAPLRSETNGALPERAAHEGLHVSEALYWEKYYDDPDCTYEWNNGILEAKPMSNPLQYILYDWFVALLRAFLEVHPIAKRMALEAGFRLAMPKRVSIRRPDLFLVRHDNPIAFQNADESYKGICDLCIESLSTSNRKAIERDTKVKKQEYAAVGVREYFILDARAVHTAFYRLGAHNQYVEIKPDAAGVIQSEVLPGFQFRIVDLYRRPSLIELAADEVYRGFVLPEYQAAQARAERERIRAEQEHSRAERLAARLRALGVEEDDRSN